MNHFLKYCRSILIAASLVATTGGHAQVAASISIQAGQPGVVIASNLFGIFFEEINYGGDGGIYAELIRNRTFGNSSSPDYWTLMTNGIASGAMTVDTAQPLNANNLNSLFLSKTSGNGGITAVNSGYWGIPLQSGATYDLNFYARGSNGFSGPIHARMESADGSSIYAAATFTGLTASWKKFSVSFNPGVTVTNARLAIGISNTAAIWLDDVSLFPRATFNGRTNGMRTDLANKIAGLNPSFFRFPGGCYVEGNILTNAFRWKRSISDPATRPGHWNGVWNYFSTDGLGFHEYLQLCEDIGAEPLFGINCGMSHNETVALADMGPWVQDALDAIEYANGNPNTTWGAQRAANGHPAPFNLKFVEIGNENGGTSYNDRYQLFYDAIKAVHPEMKLIACVWGGTPTSRPFDLMDEHYYTSPSTMASYATKYDSYDRTGPKVFVGEYAVTSGHGTYGNLAAALGEAAFMTGLERNSDIVELACYAPLFANVNGMQWHPNLINFDNSRSFGTPAYYVQHMFANHRGDMVLPTTVTLASSITTNKNIGAIGLGTWNTAASYTNLLVTSNGVTLYQSDFINSGANGWNVFNGTWGVNGGTYQQTSGNTTDCRTWSGSTNWGNYTYTLRARKDSGSEGFLILFNWRDSNNYIWWNIGGWGNTQHAIEFCQDGSKSTLAAASGSITTGSWYDIRVQLTSSNIACYLNNTLIHSVANPTISSTFHATTAYEKSSGQVIIKAVNRFTEPVNTTINLGGIKNLNTNVTLIQMSSGSSADENTLNVPTLVSPATNQIAISGTNFNITVPANSISVFRLSAGLNTYTNLSLQVPAPIVGSGQRVATTVWGQLSGNWFNLTTNSNRAITWTSSNPLVASVDNIGNVTTLQGGATVITATYGALELTSSQLLQVTNPAPATLVHRYSFSENLGTNVADSIGGTAWNGTLPRTGTFSGSGQLTLAASLQQYVQLPAGILSNYPTVTLETWVTFPNQLPVNCFFFGFGNFSGGTGYNYLFCAPRAGRAAITSGNWSSEQSVSSGIDFSYRTNLHLTFVVNPPSGYLAIYTNGTLAGINTSVSIGLNSVSNLYSWIGRSLYSGDPYADFALDEFRIYNGALSGVEIKGSDALGANQLLSATEPIFQSPVFSSSEMTLSWPLASAGFTLMTCTNLGGQWTPVTTPEPQIIGNVWQVALPLTKNAQYFRLQR